MTATAYPTTKATGATAPYPRTDAMSIRRRGATPRVTHHTKTAAAIVARIIAPRRAELEGVWIVAFVVFARFARFAGFAGFAGFFALGGLVVFESGVVF